MNRRVREFSEEAELHLSERAAELEKAGMDPGAARRQARIEFGNLDNYTEQAREAAGGAWLRALWRDAAFGLRLLRKSPGFFLWLSAVHKRLKATFPRSGVDFIHVGPRAQAWAKAGEGKLTYLFQPIPLEPVKAPTPMTTPQKKAPR